MIFENSKVYDVLKWVALVGLDAFGVAYYAIAEVWNLPCGEEVKNTCVILSVLIGTLIGVSGIQYKKQNETDEEAEG